MRTNVGALLLALISIGLSTDCFSQEESSASFLKPQSVTVFNNGFGFFESKGKVHVKDSVFKIPVDSLPKARYGTLWWSSPQEELRNAKVMIDSVKETKTIKDRHKLIKENKGNRIIAQTTSGDTVSGILGTVLDDGFFIKHKEGTSLFRYDNISRLRFPDALNTQFSENKAVKTFRMEFNPPVDSAGAPLQMMHLEKGIKWFPQYLVFIKNEKAWVTLRAILVNDIRDLENVQLNFVTGSPNLKFSGKLSPLLASEFFSYSDDSKVLKEETSVAKNYAVAFSAKAARQEDTPGNFYEELYFYKKKNISINKGDRGIFKIFQAEAPMQHIYKVNLDAFSPAGIPTTIELNPASDAPVWHTLRLKNEGNQPWAKGPATIMTSDEQGNTHPISQDEMPYTAPGNTNYLPVTKTKNITLETGEELIGNRQNVKKHENRSYDLKTVQGKIMVHNHKDEKVTLRVKKSILGEIKDSDPKWTTKQLKGDAKGLNAEQEVVWELNLDKKSSKEISYQYEVYSR